ncbi:MAG: type II secretion system protein [Planctomycetota bacterium]
MQSSPHLAPWPPHVRARRSSAGLTMIEVIVVMTILMVATLLFSTTVASVSGQQALDRENIIAVEATRTFIERLRDENFGQIVALYNADDSDDPDGPGTAPGARFAVDGLDPGDAPDGLIGEVRLPLVEVSSAPNPVRQELRENAVDPTLGTPRDLSGDSIIDGADHTDDYTLLPIEITLRWSGKAGVRELRTFTTLCEFQWN